MARRANGEWRVEDELYSALPLGQAFSGDAVAESLQGLDRTSLLAFLLLDLQAIVPRLLIARPLQEEVVPHHQNFMGDGHRHLFAPEAPFKTSKRVSQEGWGVVRGPGTLHQHPPQIAIAFARTARAPLARTFVISRAHAGPGGQPGRRPKVAHRRADLRQDRPSRGRFDARDTGELLYLRRHRLRADRQCRPRRPVVAGLALGLAQTLGIVRHSCVAPSLPMLLDLPEESYGVTVPRVPEVAQSSLWGQSSSWGDKQGMRVF
jgi:hypothetical protein